ncbi:MAG TPA: DNA internalization-related competence protein ComEC/Rec2 [Rubricoccaceae bacterium]|nr:DNA internalization-related competence protein ComEC/Rec2 [Rubricoccaceae bacterium]
MEGVHGSALPMPLAPPPAPLRPFARPALAAALGAGLGVALAARWPGAGITWWAALLATAIVLAVSVAWTTRRRLVTPRPIVFAAAVALGAIALGGARMAAWQALPPDHVAFAAAAAQRLEEAGGDPTITLYGHVAEAPVPTATGNLRFTLRADSAARGTTRHPLHGGVQVTLGRPRYGAGPPPVYPRLEAGDRVIVTGPLRPVPPLRNPADFDYGAWLRRQGVHATVAVYDAEAVRFVGSDAGPLRQVVTATQARVRRALGQHVRSDEARRVLAALLIADRSGLDPDMRTAFVETGLMHLLAVSGLHLVLVGLVLYRLLKPLLGRLGWPWRRVEGSRAALTLALLGLYVLVTGATVSVVRAFVMTALWIGGTVLERPSDALNGLGAAALVLLLFNPATLFDVGFQLSFAAVAALLVLVPVLRDRVPERWSTLPIAGGVLDGLLVSLAATLGTGPILLYHFGQLPLAGVVLNLAGIPASGIALGAGLGSALCAGWAPFAAEAFGAVAELGALALLVLSRAGAEAFEWSLLHRFVRDPWLLAAIAAALLALAARRRPRVRWGLAIGSLGAVAVSAWAGVARGDNSPRLDVVFLDVGQGDAALVTLPGPYHVLIDTGPRDPYFDAGARTVLPHLRRFGVRRLDAVVISHPHADHYGGLETVLREVPVGRVITSGQPSADSLWNAALAVARARRVPVRSVRAGDTLAAGPAAHLHVLSPAALPELGDDPNDASVVLRLEYGATSFLFTGDAEAGSEAALLAHYGPALRSTVVKVGHHGSRTSSTAPFVQAVAAGGAPAFAVVPVARRNRYGLPDEEPLGRWMMTGAAVVQTGREGAVWLRSDGQRVERVRWR